MLGFVFQQFSLLPTLTVTENVELPLMFLGLQANRPHTLARDQIRIFMAFHSFPIERRSRAKQLARLPRFPAVG